MRFIRRIGLYNELSHKAADQKGKYTPATPKITSQGKQISG